MNINIRIFFNLVLFVRYFVARLRFKVKGERTEDFA